jgi:hypothetical protein
LSGGGVDRFFSGVFRLSRATLVLKTAIFRVQKRDENKCRASNPKGIKFILSFPRLRIVDILMSAERGCKLKDISRESGISASADSISQNFGARRLCSGTNFDGYFISPKKRFIRKMFGKYDSRIARRRPRDSRLSKKYNENVLLAIRERQGLFIGSRRADAR